VRINIDAVVGQVLESSKYRTLCPDLIRRVADREIARNPSLKTAVKATKNTLHQIAGAYLEGKPRYDQWAETLANPPLESYNYSFEWMQHHASTAERLPFAEEFYRTLFGAIDSPVESILDVACGLNPLAIPLMRLPERTAYFACDIFTDQMAFLEEWLARFPLSGAAEVRDVISRPPTQRADIALVLKLLPVLEQWDKNAGIALLRALNCPILIVSFPTKSLSGKGNKGMADNYAARFLTQIEPEGWQSARFDFPNEMAFVVRK
jgi:16S rRNA (guanine(1405)-N(7))-methyltransferase